MRRVVSDQIRALKELAALVADSGVDFDVAEPAAQGIAPAAAAAGGARYSQPMARTVEAPRRVESPPQREAAAPRAVEAIATIAPPVLESVISPPAPPDEPAPSGARPEGHGWHVSPPAQQSPASDRSQSGWLSNLLAAASREEPAAAAPRPPETLEDLTQSIAGLVDSAAAAETWDRWRRGDTAAVSRRLYTEAGQQAFDEIRRRYRTDPQFCETANRYVQEFERLLAKVGQNDRDGSQWRAYLMSNTGKVYTILAHASGRLG